MKNVAYNMDCMEAMRHIPDKFFDLAVVDLLAVVTAHISERR